MPIDIRKLRPTELVQLLNSSPELGEVVTERVLTRHRNRAGLRIGDGKTVDLLRYVAWLVLERQRLRSERGLTGYEAHKERTRRRQAEQTKAGRDIGEVPEPQNWERRNRAERDFRFFCEQYFPQTFYLPWSDDHLKVVAKIEAVVLEGGLVAIAMPRGAGKTVLTEKATLWAMLYGHRLFVAVIGPDEGHAVDRVKNLKIELECNDLLCDDFPEVCVPIRKLEGINQRRLLFRNELVRMEFTAKQIALPNLDLPWNQSGGAIVATAGLTGQIRGLNMMRDDGTVLRPSLVLIDDPQTDESARSPSQCAQRERILNGAVLGLAGPTTRIAALMPCTVVCQGDLADRVLNREQNPQWQGERTKMVYTWPTREDLWAKYCELWRVDPEGEGRRRAAEFYCENRAAMDEGAEVAWPERHNPDEYSAIQHAYNLRLQRKDAAFFAEFQNEPLSEHGEDEGLLTADEIMAKLNGHRRAVATLAASRLTAFIDVQEKLLYWLVAAWEEDFTGYVVDYGTEPDQGLAYFTLREARRTLGRAAPGRGLEGAIYAGLERLTQRLLGREWPVDGGGTLRISRCLIDAGWGQTTDVIYKFCRQAQHASVLLPSHGRYVGASSLPFSDYVRKPGDRVGANWRIPAPTGRRAVRHALYDTNFWKSFIQTRLAVGMGDPGCLSLFGNRPDQHRLLADHLTSEYRVQTQGRGRTVDEWKQKPERSDNHWLDCLVGAAVAAAIEGIDLAERRAAARKPQRSYAERYAQWRSSR